jgi:hypothetical protein
MDKILDDVIKDADEALGKCIDKVSKESVQKLKNTSPKKTGDYAKSWSIKRGKGNERVVYNKQYQLTHLLENGHVIVNAKGTYGRTNGIKHIAPVEEWASEELPREIERELQ